MSPRREAYHHGNLKAALVDAAVGLISQRGVHGFSLAEVSRRVGVAASAPYAHYADREDLLAAVAVQACQLFHSAFPRAGGQASSPAARLAAIADAYVRFAAGHEPHFRTLFEAGLDKRRHPELAAAEQPIDDAFMETVRELPGAGDDHATEALAAAVEATAHGYATLLLDGRFGERPGAVDRAAEGAARATLTLVEGRALLRPPGRAIGRR